MSIIIGVYITSSNVGMDGCAPHLHTVTALHFVANLQASVNVNPSTIEWLTAPIYESPAPVVSTASTFFAGITSIVPFSYTTAPSDPNVIITLLLYFSANFFISSFALSTESTVSLQ